MSYEVYNMQRLDKTVSSSNKSDGLIVLCTDEERAYSASENLYTKNGLPLDIFVIYFDVMDKVNAKTFFKKTNCNLISLCQISSTLSDSLTPCLIQLEAFVKNKATITIDITCMPIPIFAQIIHYLYAAKKSLIAYYTQPDHYKLDKLFDFAAYNGEIEIVNIPGYAGSSVQRGEVKHALFYQIGFEVKYINTLIEQQVYPDAIVPINGFPSYFPKYKDISLINNNVNYYAESKEIVYSEASNPFDSYNQIIKLCAQYPNCCISILTSGTKPMALGACLFALKSGNIDVRLLFPYPANYNRTPSSGNGIVWEYRL